MTILEDYQWLFRKSPIMATSIGEDGTFQDVNDAFLERLGYERDEMLGRKPGETFVDDSGLVCVVCIDAPRDTRLMPCEHSALCGDCAKACRDRQGSCPICNTKIKAIEWGSFARTFALAGLNCTIVQKGGGPSSLYSCV